MLAPLLLALSAAAPPTQDTLLAELHPGPDSSLPSSFLAGPGRALFHAISPTTDPWSELYASDGTPGGTVPLGLPSGSTFGYGVFGRLGGSFLIVKSAFLSPPTWYRSDGTPGSLIPFETPGPTGFIEEVAPLSPLVEFEGRAYVAVRYMEASAVQLWGSDLTTEGTGPVTQIFPNTLDQVLSIDDRVWFTAGYVSGGTDEVSLWSTDGTPNAEVLEADAAAGTVGALVASQGRAVFTRVLSNGSVLLQSKLHGQPALNLDTLDVNAQEPAWVRLFSTEAGVFALVTTAAGVERLVHASPDAPGATTLLDLTDRRAYGTTVVPGGLAFLAEEPDGTNRVWFSDGTTAGTQPAGALPFAEQDFGGTAAIHVDTRLLVASASFETGGSIYECTPNGVVLLHDLPAMWTQTPPLLGVPPVPERGFAVVNGSLLFAGTDPLRGTELHALPLAWTSGGTAFPIGGGCGPGPDLVPRLANAGPLGLGDGAEFRLEPCPPAATTAWFRDTGLLPLPPVGECGILLPAPVLSAVVAADGSGAATWSPVLPADIGLLGLPIRQQALVLDPFGPLLGAASLSDGLEVTLGP